MKTTMIRFIAVLPILISGCTSVNEQQTLLRSDTKATRQDMSFLLETRAQPVPIGTPAETKYYIAPGQRDSSSSELEVRDQPNIDSAPLNLQ
jgi:hypothetical protein